MYIQSIFRSKIAERVPVVPSQPYIDVVELHNCADSTSNKTSNQTKIDIHINKIMFEPRQTRYIYKQIKPKQETN